MQSNGSNLRTSGRQDGRPKSALSHAATAIEQPAPDMKYPLPGLVRYHTDSHAPFLQPFLYECPWLHSEHWRQRRLLTTPSPAASGLKVRQASLFSASARRARRLAAKPRGTEP